MNLLTLFFFRRRFLCGEAASNNKQKFDFISWSTLVFFLLTCCFAECGSGQTSFGFVWSSFSSFADKLSAIFKKVFKFEAPDKQGSSVIDYPSLGSIFAWIVLFISKTCSLPLEAVASPVKFAGCCLLMSSCFQSRCEFFRWPPVMKTR